MSLSFFPPYNSFDANTLIREKLCHYIKLNYMPSTGMKAKKTAVMK